MWKCVEVKIDLGVMYVIRPIVGLYKKPASSAATWVSSGRSSIVLVNEFENDILFNRGAQKSVQGLEFGPLTMDKILIERMECTGSETNITGCKVVVGSNCPFIHEQVVGVRCHRDPQSLCAKDEHSHGNACYKLISDEMSTRERARSLCEQTGGSLLYIHSQVLKIDYFFA